MKSEARCCICGERVDPNKAPYSERMDRWFCQVKDWQACENRTVKKAKEAA